MTPFSNLKKNILVILLLVTAIIVKAETIESWYANAQQRIDTLRKGNFGIKIVDKNGQDFSGKFHVRMFKHEFPFGIAFDLYEGAISNGNSYATSNKVTAPSDAEIYQSERWYSFIAYSIPVQKNKQYKLTLKFAEIYFDTKGSRLFNVFVEGSKFLSNFDVLAVAGAKNIAKDTSIIVLATDSLINIELSAIIDNAAIKGIEIENMEEHSITRINCGGGAVTTADGHAYVGDENFFDSSASRVPTEEQWMKAAMQKYFNYGVSGNSFKWSGIQPQHTAPNYTAFDNAVKWTQSIGWELRAHTLLWGGYEYSGDHEMPRWVKDLPTPKAITDTCKMRVIREVTHYKGIVKEYDVMNEPLHAKYLSSIVGDSINWNCFKWARSADPEAALFINDYNVEYNWGDAKKYRDLILKIKSMGAPVTGVGMQAHFWDNMRPQLNELVTNINIVAEAGLPIKLTEFDNGDISQEAQASDFVMVATVAFSHPSINGMISWGLSDKGAWRKNSGLFDANHKPKLAADTLLYLTKKLWATNFDSISNGDIVNFNAYYGYYNVEVVFDSITKVFTIPCIKTNKDSIFVLHEEDAIVKGPQFVSATLLNDNSLKINFDKALNSQTISKGDFKFFSNNPVRIQEVNIDANDSSSLLINLQNEITPDDYLAVSYFPGSLISSDGGKLNAFGPESVTNLTSGLISGSVINDGNTIEAVFNRKIKNIDQNLESFSLKVNNQTVTINAIAYRDNDSTKVLLTLDNKLISSDKITLRYTKGSLTTVNGFDCQSSSEVSVTNLWPKLVSSEVLTTGDKIVLLFNTLLDEAKTNIDAFEIKVDDLPIDILTVTVSGKDSSKLSFSISDKIADNQEVTIAYNPGTIKAFNGNNLAKFESKVLNNSIITSIRNAEQKSCFSVFPNPASDILNINCISSMQLIRIINSQGLEIYKLQSINQNNVIPVSSFPRGIYVIQLIDKNGRMFMDKLILK